MSAPITVGELDAAAWWARSDLWVDRVDPSCWVRRIVVEVPGDGAGVCLEVSVSDEGGPVVDVVTVEHSARDLSALAAVLPDLAARVASLPTSRLPA